MGPMHSLPPTIETEIRDDMSTRTIPSSGMEHQSTAVADYTNEIERQRQITENELRQQETRQTRQWEIVRQGAASELQPTTQALTESHRHEATSATTNLINLAEDAWNKLNKENQEQRQMAENDERLGARSRQVITARKNQPGNQAKEQETPQRAQPKAKSEPNPKPIVEKTAAEDEGKPEENHTPNGKRGRPSNNPMFKKKDREGNGDKTKPIKQIRIIFFKYRTRP